MNPLLIEKIQANPDLISADAEQQYTVTGVSWQTYEALLADLGDDFSGLRVHYLEGTLEITMPGRKHEVSKENIARLLSAYFEETRTRFYGLGSTTFKSEAKRRGAEPDTSFCIDTDKEFPDIAIELCSHCVNEVIQTSGGIDKLEIYKGLGVPEVWFWEKGKFVLYHLREDAYQSIDRSQFLPSLDLELLATSIQHPEPLNAVLEFRAALRAHLQSH